MSSNHPLFEKVFDGPPAPTGPPLTGEVLRDVGMQSVLAHTPEEYKEKFKSAVESLRGGTEFTAEDIRSRIGDPPKGTHYNVFGALMNGMATRKLIRPTGRMVNATRPSLHASKIAVWERV